VHEYGPVEVSEDEIIDFARRYDPQLIHIDPEYARIGPYGGLIASGWHTTSLMMRLAVNHYLPTVASIGSPGVDELRWLRPVRPGDALRLRVTVVEVRTSKSKPDRGILRSKLEVLNQRAELVLSLSAVNFILTRSALAAIAP
jgi:acyl dehydratase